MKTKDIITKMKCQILPTSTIRNILTKVSRMYMLLLGFNKFNKVLPLTIKNCDKIFLKIILRLKK